MIYEINILINFKKQQPEGARCSKKCSVLQCYFGFLYTLFELLKSGLVKSVWCPICRCTLGRSKILCLNNWTHRRSSFKIQCSLVRTWTCFVHTKSFSFDSRKMYKKSKLNKINFKLSTNDMHKNKSTSKIKYKTVYNVNFFFSYSNSTHEYSFIILIR